jgi:hypothetical protein
MKQIWIFGDSYAEDYTQGNPKILEQQWHRLLGTHFNAPITNRGLRGSSLEWLYYTWQQERQKINSGDIVIAMITNLRRRWLLQESPGITSFRLLTNKNINHVDPKTFKAIELYYRYLDNDLYMSSLLENWLYNVNDLAREKQCPVLIFPVFPEMEEILPNMIPQFPHLHFPKGYMFDVSDYECSEDLRQSPIVTDGRCNHLLPPNHHVLKDKIVSYIEQQISIDLTVGFHKNIINRSNFDSLELLARPEMMKFS